MKAYFDVAQGSADWFKLRMGIPTASRFDEIVTPKTGKYSESAKKYAYELIAERLLKTPMETLEGQQWMERGKELEPEAARQYEWVTENETVVVGFVTTDDGLIGASPDRLIKGKPAALEIKCPAPHTHVGYLLDGHNDKYRPQVQGQIFVCELEYAEFYSFHPRMPAVHIITERDDKFQELLAAGLDHFNTDLFEMIERAKSMGVFQAYEEVATPVDAARANQLREEFIDQVGIPP
jgi:putative phage-type endonuclease